MLHGKSLKSEVACNALAEGPGEAQAGLKRLEPCLENFYSVLLEL